VPSHFPGIIACSRSRSGSLKLVGQWEGQYGYRPLLAESFSDPEGHAGTVYKATNWVQAGLTKGYSQNHTDFYVPNGRPKKLWLKELAPNACGLMCARELPPACQGAEAAVLHEFLKNPTCASVFRAVSTFAF
jgi:hypothetical protein